MKQFKRIYIEITNSCNLSCSFCPQSHRAKRRMTVEEFIQVLDKIKGHGNYVYLHIKGEPMCHPDFLEILDICHYYGLKVNLTTNGTLFKRYGEALLKARSLRQVSISLQSQDNLEDENAYSQYMEEVLKIVRTGKEQTNIIFELRLWNYKNIEMMTISDHNYIALSMIMKTLDVAKEVIEAVPKGKGSKLTEQIYLSKSTKFQWPDLKADVIGEDGTCYGLRQQIGILANGDVVPCCLDGEGVITLGNIFKDDFETIVTGIRAKEIVKGFEEQRIVEPLCMKCGYRTKFK